MLSSILTQNPEIHAEGNSAVCQLMWDTQRSVLGSEQIKANNKNILDSLVRLIPHTYYRDVVKPVVVDKCRSWTLPANVQMLNRYFDNSPKIIVLVRPLAEIVASFMALRKANGWSDLEAGLLDDRSEPIMRSLAGVEWARKNNNGEFLFVSYDELVDKTQETIDRIYAHCGWEPFGHDLHNIVNQFKENDEIYGLKGQHDVRPEVTRRKHDVVLGTKLVEKCKQLDEWSGYGSILCAN